jgi:hypothetical protein
MVWLLASAAALCTAVACSGDDEDAPVTTAGLPNQPGVGGSSANAPASPPPATPPLAPAPGGGGETPNVTQQTPPATNGGVAAGTADAGAGEEPVADAGPAEPVADAAPPVANPPPNTPPPNTPPPNNPPPPVEQVGFSDVFPILVAACGNCHGANAPGARPRFAQTGNEAASLTAALATAPQGGTVANRIIVRGVTQRNMPPACGGGALGTGACLDQAEADLLQAWVDQGSQP